MMTERRTVEAPSIAAFAHELAALPHETRAIVTATERGAPWATVEVAPMTDTYRAVFPVDSNGVRGDARKRSQAGVMATERDGWRSLPLVIDRARRLAACCVQAGPHGPSHDGATSCRSGSLASGGHRSHCTCDTCF